MSSQEQIHFKTVTTDTPQWLALIAVCYKDSPSCSLHNIVQPCCHSDPIKLYVEAFRASVTYLFKIRKVFNNDKKPTSWKPTKGELSAKRKLASFCLDWSRKYVSTFIKLTTSRWQVVMHEASDIFIKALLRLCQQCVVLLLMVMALLFFFFLIVLFCFAKIYNS